MLKNILKEYEYDWASVSGIPREHPGEFPFRKLQNKTFVVTGQPHFVKCVVYSLLAVNEEKNLNFKVIIADESDDCLKVFNQEILKEYPVKYINLKDLKEKTDYFICTGVCNKNLKYSADCFTWEISKLNSILNAAKNTSPNRFVLLSDYRAYGKNENGVLVSENENCKIHNSGNMDFETNILQTVESLCTCYARQFNFNTVILRTGMIAGAQSGLDNNFLTNLLTDVAQGKEITIPRSRNKYTYIYLSDVLQSIFYAFEEFKADNVYNIGGKDTTISTGVMAEKLYEIFPDITNINLENTDKDPCIGSQINTSKVDITDFNPLISFDDLAQLFIKSVRFPDIPFSYEEPHGGKLTVIQNILLNYLLEMDRVCQKHNIKYFLGGGTLLGAIRHNGFIPWDDDVDVMMLRDDYDKFLKIAQNELPNGLFLQTCYTDKHCFYPFAKIRINNTMFATKFSKNHSGMHNGMAFDIFCHDNTANSSFVQKLHLQTTLLTRAMVFNKWNHRQIDNGSKIQSFIGNILKTVFPIRFSQWLQNHSIKFFRGKKNAKYLYDGMGRNVYHGSFPKQWLDEVIYHDFMGHKLPIPKEYDKYLKYLYGNDYMQLVPASERRTSHSIVMLDLADRSQTSL